MAFAASGADEGLRIRLNLSEAPARLHRLLWETLRDPTSLQQDGRLATNDRILLSRYMSSSDLRPVYLRRRGSLRALVVIPDPADMAQGLNLDWIGAEAEWKRFQSSWPSIPATLLSGGGKAALGSIDRTLLANEAHGGFDILYCVCHGAIRESSRTDAQGEQALESAVYLEDDAGATTRVPGQELVGVLGNIGHRPRLVVLASCQSAGTGTELTADDKGALAAIGPRLAVEGIPAVLAMRGKVRQDSAACFLETFFAQLAAHGQIDLAVAGARRRLLHEGHEDWWMPVLVTRLQDPCIWAEHGGGSQEEDPDIDPLLRSVIKSECTPILGPDLAASIFGSHLELARNWARNHQFPMAESERDSLPQVAQYLEHMKGHGFLREELEQHIRDTLLRNFGQELPESMCDTRPSCPPLSSLLREIGRIRRAHEHEDPYWVLARLPFSVYVTADRHDLLYDALCEAPVDPRDPERKKRPRWDVCRWPVNQDDLGKLDSQGRPAWPESIFVKDPDYKPSVSEPLVFQAFGHLDYPETLVLTEDDYFDYLIGIIKNTMDTHDKGTEALGTTPIPMPVRMALSLRGLLFLGFRLSDWEFRTLFRHILAQETSTLRDSRGPKNVSVQLMPAAGEYIAPQGAKAYLERYLTVDNHIDIVWKPVDVFVQRLHELWQAAVGKTSG
jgi:hypothetical protein